MIAKLSWKNLWHKPWNTLLSVILLVCSIALMTVLVLVQHQFEDQFQKNVDDIDLVLGAPGSPLQLILSSVYQVDAPTGNISYAEAKTYMKHPHVKQAIPLAFGDNYVGFKIVGTTWDYAKKYKANLQQGKAFAKDFEVVVGAQVAQKLSLKLGDTFYGTHGDAMEGEVHDNHAYEVVGILEESGQVIDHLILCTISSVWNIHAEHEHLEGMEHETMQLTEEQQEITAVLLTMKNQIAKLTWPRIIPQNTKMQAASPAIEINRLFSLFGIGLEALTYLSYALLVLSGLSIFIALYSNLKERQYEFALMRISGARALQLFWSLLLESWFLTFIGILFGAILGRLALILLSWSTEEQFKLVFDPSMILWQKEGMLWILTIFVGFLAACIPAIKAYQIQISKTLTHA
jgi:putative ABC transport system permease protein